MTPAALSRPILAMFLLPAAHAALAREALNVSKQLTRNPQLPCKP